MIKYYTDASINEKKKKASIVFVKLDANNNLIDIIKKDFVDNRANISNFEMTAINKAIQDAEDNLHNDFELFCDCAKTVFFVKDMGLKIKKVKAHSDCAGNRLADSFTRLNPLVCKVVKKELLKKYKGKPINSFSIELILNEISNFISLHKSFVMHMSGKGPMSSKIYNKCFKMFVEGV